MHKGEKLKLIRQEKGLSQYRLAQLSGVSQAYISKYERGENDVSLTILEKVCPCLGISVTDFLAMTTISFDASKKETSPKIRAILRDLETFDDRELELVKNLVTTIKNQNQ